MPEYSSTTITPADAVKVPAMNGSTSGNFQLDALRNFILASKAQANGLASLDANGKLPSSQLPDLADDVLVYASYASFPASGTAGKLYIAGDTNEIYRWDDSLGTPAYVYLKVDWTDLTNGSVTVKKAECDASGNTITSTYETKADANNLKNALETYEATANAEIQNNSQRITNIETALAGTVVQTNIDSTQKNVKTILSADELLPWAILKRVGARSTQFNQLVQNGNFDGTAYWNYDGASFSQSGNKGIVVGDSNYANIYKSLPLISGHTYLAFGTAKASASITIKLYFGTSSRVNIDSKTVTADTTTFFAGVGTYTTQDKVLQFGCESGAGGATVEFSNVMVFDLTAMNEATLTADQFKVKYPASYYPFNAGNIYDVPPLSFLCRGTNQWDEEWELGGYDSSTGQPYTISDRIRTKNPMSVIPNTQYYIVAPNDVKPFFYDASDNFVGTLSSVHNTYVTTPSNAVVMRFYVVSAYGATYNHDIMLCLNSVTDKTYKPANHMTIDTSFMDGTHYVNPNCYDYAENVYVNGILKRKMQTVVENVDLGTLDWTWNSTFEVYISLGLSGKANGTKNIICSKYGTNSSNNWSALLDHEISGNSTNATIYIRDSSINYQTDLVNGKIEKLDGVYAFYELATLPDPTYGDPIPNFPCEDGSTIMANTPQADIVNAIDVPSTIAYMTQI